MLPSFFLFTNLKRETNKTPFWHGVNYSMHPMNIWEHFVFLSSSAGLTVYISSIWHPIAAKVKWNILSIVAFTISQYIFLQKHMGKIYRYMDIYLYSFVLSAELNVCFGIAMLRQLTPSHAFCFSFTANNSCVPPRCWFNMKRCKQDDSFHCIAANTQMHKESEKDVREMCVKL